MTGLLIGFMTGGVFGIVMMSLVIKGKQCDEKMEEMWIRQVSQKEERVIRFTDSRGHLLFQIPDDGTIQLMYENGESVVSLCRYQNPDHFRINNKVWQTQEFAEEMEKRGISYYPLIKDTK